MIKEKFAALPDTAADFWSSAVLEPATGCWHWQRSMDVKGYGRIKRNGKWIGAHRAAYMFAHHVILHSDEHVCRKCDNPRCVNPSHLFVGTNADNIRDKIAKGRAACTKGENNGNAKMTSALVTELRNRYNTEHISGTRLAAEYGLKKSAVYYALNGACWGHVVAD